MSFHSLAYDASPTSCNEFLIPSPKNSPSYGFDTDLSESPPASSGYSLLSHPSTQSSRARRHLGFDESRHRRTRHDSDPSAPPSDQDDFEHETVGLYAERHNVLLGQPPSPFEPPPPYEVQDSNPRATTRDESSIFDELWMIDSTPPPFNPSFSNSFDLAIYRERQRKEREENEIMETIAKEALAQHAAERCCYGGRAARHMRVHNLVPYLGVHYVLETFYQERSASRHEEPYCGQTIDGIENGSPPRPWDIVVPEPENFKRDEVHLEVPHTASVKKCGGCSGSGDRICKECHGHGDIRCHNCDGQGNMTHSSSESRHCKACTAGRKSCGLCKGERRLECSSCKGNGHVKQYIRLTVSWRVMRDEKVLDRSGRLPKKCISDARGENVLHEESPLIYPLTNFPDSEIQAASRRLIVHHKDKLSHAQIKAQRQYVRHVPITEVFAEWKRRNFRFFLYGTDNRVHCPDYPQKCFGTCTLL